MVNYQNGKIYKIINDSMPNMVYYGSTCNTFAKRMGQHKELRYSSRILFEYGNPQMILIEKYPCNDKMELKSRERYYIENNECVNKQIPGRTKKEYRQDNKERIAIRDKKYYEDNKEKISLQQKEYRDSHKEQNKQWREANKEKISLHKKQKMTCDCGSSFRISDKSKHYKSKKHNAFISSN